MMQNKRIALVSLFVSLSAITAISVSLAWYQIQVNATAEYQGTSVGNDTRFQIGLKSASSLGNVTAYGLTEDAANPGIYWAEADLSNECLNHYLEANGYATNVLNGVTSGSYALNGGEFSLKTNPNYLNNYSLTSAAGKANYIYFDFVFKVYKSSTLQSTGNIYLRDAILTGESSVYKTTRIYGKSDSFSSIINLDSTANGSTSVGGVLDLNKDGLFDSKKETTTETIDDEEVTTSTLKEYPYGEFNSDIVYVTEANPAITGGHDFVDCFNAKHEENSYQFTNTDAKVASYYGKTEIIDNHMSLCKISETNKYAELETSIYLEGWDHNYVENIAGKAFNLSLTFESDLSNK